MEQDMTQPGQTKLGAVNWLYAIAALTAVNTVAVISGAEFSMIFGLTSALVATYMFNTVIAVAFTVVLAGVIAGLAFLIKQRMLWALVVAMVVYVLDALVALWGAFIVGDTSMYLDLAAHAWVVVVMWGSLQIIRAEAAAAANPLLPVAPVAPVPEQPVPQPEQL